MSRKTRRNEFKLTTNQEPSARQQSTMPSFGIHVFSWPKEAEDVAADRIKEASKKRLLGPCFPARDSWYQRKCLSRVYFMSPLIIMACLAMLKTKVLPAMRMHNYAATFKPTECTTAASNMTDMLLTCDCRKSSKDKSGCKKQYLCFQLSVTIETTKGLKVTTSLYEDMEALSRKFHDCAVLNKLCKKHDPADTVSSLAEHYAAPGATFHCLFNPNEPSEVLLHLVALPGSFWAMLVTVSVLLTASVAAPVVAYLTCGFTYVCSRSPPPDIQQEVERRSLGLSSPGAPPGGPDGTNGAPGTGLGQQPGLQDYSQTQSVQQPLLMNTVAPPPPYQQACASPIPQYTQHQAPPPTPEAADGIAPQVPVSTLPVPDMAGGPHLQAPSRQSSMPPTPCSAHRPPPPVILYVHPGGIVSTAPPPGVAPLNYQPSPCPSATRFTGLQMPPNEGKQGMGQHMFYQ